MVMPGYGSLHRADTALRNVQLFGGRYPVVQTVAFTRARACLRVFCGVAGSDGGVSAAFVVGVLAVAATVVDELAPGWCPESAAPGSPSHAPSVSPTATVATNATASSNRGSLPAPRFRRGRLGGDQPLGSSAPCPSSSAPPG